MTTPTPKRNPQISVTLPPELYQEVIAAAEAADLPLVYWMRQAIRAKLKAELDSGRDQEPPDGGA